VNPSISLQHPLADPPAGNGFASQVAVLGIGLMGLPLATRLCQAGVSVSVWNRTHAKAEKLAAQGARVSPTPGEAVAQADVILISLEDGPAVESVLFQLGTAGKLRPGSVVIDMSSIPPRQARDHAARLGALGVHHIDAPVSGGTLGAEQGTLAIMVGGKADVFDRVNPLLALLGHATHVGSHGAGQLAKLANQMIVGVTIGAVAEALLLCERGGANMAKVKEAITGGFADSRILQVHGQRMIDRDFTRHGAVTLQLKDMRNALSTAHEIGFEAPITQLFEKLYAEAADHGLADLDHSALFVELASRNGMN
jgi:3-hydroxyisobutyrate dehydrogenase-like beta-hydroxyacid dehydrogenase